jgi:hypothetical protein
MENISLHELVPDGCPPDEASPPDLEVYRFVKEDPPLEWDFESSRERHPDEDFGENACMRSGLSVFSDLREAEQARKAIPGMKSKHIARGHLPPASGLIKHTPRRSSDTHHTWWKDTTFDATQRFLSVSPPIA